MESPLNHPACLVGPFNEEDRRDESLTRHGYVLSRMTHPYVCSRPLTMDRRAFLCRHGDDDAHYGPCPLIYRLFVVVKGFEMSLMKLLRMVSC